MNKFMKKGVILSFALAVGITGVGCVNQEIINDLQISEQGKEYINSIVEENGMLYEGVSGEVLEIYDNGDVKIFVDYAELEEDKADKTDMNHWIILKATEGAYKEEVAVGDVVSAFTKVGTPQTMELPESFRYKALIKNEEGYSYIVSHFDDNYLSHEGHVILNLDNDEYKNQDLLIKFDVFKESYPAIIDPEEVTILK